MRRRGVLKSAIRYGTVSIAVLAGCSNTADEGTPDNDSSGDTSAGGCEIPGDDLTAAFPEHDEYERISSTSVPDNTGDSRGEAYASISFFGPDDRFYSLDVIRYSDASTATEAAPEEARSTRSSTGEDDSIAGYLVVDEYLYIGIGPDRDRLTEFMELSPPLSGCVETNVEFL